MKRSLYYNPETGELLHSHYEVRVIEQKDEARLTAPAPAELDADLAELVSRGLDGPKLARVTTSVPPQSSRRTRRWVDVKTGRLRSERIELDTRTPGEGDA
jgi:hypothetical protein